MAWYFENGLVRPASSASDEAVNANFAFIAKQAQGIRPNCLCGCVVWDLRNGKVTWRMYLSERAQSAIQDDTGAYQAIIAPPQLSTETIMKVLPEGYGNADLEALKAEIPEIIDQSLVELRKDFDQLRQEFDALSIPTEERITQLAEAGDKALSGKIDKIEAELKEKIRELEETIEKLKSEIARFEITPEALSNALTALPNMREDSLDRASTKMADKVSPEDIIAHDREAMLARLEREVNTRQIGHDLQTELFAHFSQGTPAVRIEDKAAYNLAGYLARQQR